MDVEELASDVRRARGFDDPAAFVEMMETSATTGLRMPENWFRYYSDVHAGKHLARSNRMLFLSITSKMSGC